MAKITIVGCGSGALATAADLSVKGHEITLYADSSHRKNFEGLIEDKEITCHSEGIQYKTAIRTITCTEENAFKDFDLVIVCTPSYAHEDIAERIAPYLKNDDVVLLSPGGTGGSLVFARIFEQYGLNARLCEFHTLPYAARKNSNNDVTIFLYVDYLLFAAFPAANNKELYNKVKEIYPKSVLCKSVLETGLNNGNAITHPAPMLLNAGKIEFYGKHSHYEEGITPSVADVIQQLDNERKRICKSFGYDELDIKERLYLMGYCPKAKTVYESIHGSKEVFLSISGPNSLKDRYLTEDTPYSLVAMCSLAKAAGMNVPLMNSIVNLAGALMNENYWVTGRNLESMGLSGIRKSEILHYVKTGIRYDDKERR